MPDLVHIARAFDLAGPIEQLAPYGRGRINDSYLVGLSRGKPRRVLLQRLNTAVFPAPERIIHNIRRLAEHLEARQARLAPAVPRLRLPALIPTGDGTYWWRDPEGGFWRALEFIEGSRTLARAETPDQAAQCGWVLGRFHRLTWDLPAHELHDTLPGFHQLPRYLEAFDQALGAWSGTGSHELERALAAVAQRRATAGRLEEARSAGPLRERVIHGDPKLDNILFRRDAERAWGLVDLDTVKPGLPHYDLGDCLRSVCNPAGEAEPWPRWELALGKALLGAYLAEMGALFGAEDYDLVYDCARLLPFELGLRFLTDHLEGDRYFKTAQRGENLQRALTQFRLTMLVEEREHEIRALVAALRTRAAEARPDDSPGQF